MPVSLPAAFVAQTTTATDFADPVFLTPGKYRVDDLSAMANGVENPPAGGGDLLVTWEKVDTLSWTLEAEQTGQEWKQGVPTAPVSYGGWTETADRGFSRAFTGTSILGATAVDVAAIHAQLSSYGDEVADFATITDAEPGVAGPGYVRSYEVPANSGRYYREIFEAATGAFFSNHWDGAAWGGWQGGAAVAITNENWILSLGEALTGQNVHGQSDGPAVVNFSRTIVPPLSGTADFELTFGANSIVPGALDVGTILIGTMPGASDVFDSSALGVNLSSALLERTEPITLNPGFPHFVTMGSGPDGSIIDPYFSVREASNPEWAASVIPEVTETVVGSVAGSDGPQTFTATFTPDVDGVYPFSIGAKPGSLTTNLAIRLGTATANASILDGFTDLSLRLTNADPVRTFPVQLVGGTEYIVGYQPGNAGSTAEDVFFSLRPISVVSINASGFPTPGDENSLGINSADNLQTLVEKAENYVDWAPSVAPEVTETLVPDFLGSTAVPFTATFTADETGYYIAEHRALAVNPNAYIQIGTTLGGTDLLDTIPSTADRLFPTELTKFYRIFMRKGQTAFAQTAPGGAGTAQGMGFSIRPISRGNEYTPTHAIPLLGNYSIDLRVGNEHNEGSIDIAEPGVTIETGHDLLSADTLHIVVTDINQPGKPWDIIEIPIPEFLAKGESFGHVYGTGYIEVFVGNAATGQILFEDENRNLTYERSWVTKRTLVGTSGISPRVGEIVPVAAVGFKTPAQGYLPWKDGRVVNGAVDYPVFASMVPWWVDGDDLLFEGTVDGAYIRNLGGNAGPEGTFQGQATAVNGLSATYRRPNNPTPSQVNGGGGNMVRGNTNQPVPITGDTETRPDSYAFQHYVIVDTYRETAGAGAASITPAHGRMELTNNQAIAASIQAITMNTGGGSDRGVYPFDTVTVAKGGMVVTPGGFVDNDATTQVMDGTNTTSSMVVPRPGDYEFKIAVPSALDSTIESDDRPLAAISVNGSIVKVYNIHDLANSSSSADQDKVISDIITLPANALVQAGYYIEGGDDEAWGYRDPLETIPPDSATVVYGYFELRQLPESVTPLTTSTGHEPPHIQSFDTTTDWGTAAGGFYTITVPAATHGKTAPSTIQFWQDIAGVLGLTQVDTVRRQANGDVEFSVPDSPDARFAGEVSIGD